MPAKNYDSDDENGTPILDIIIDFEQKRSIPQFFPGVRGVLPAITKKREFQRKRLTKLRKQKQI